MTPEIPAASAGPIHRGAYGLQERLKLVLPEPRFQHELLPAPLVSAQSLGALLAAVRAPFVGLALLGFKPKPNTGRRLTGKLRFGIYLVTTNPKSGPRLLGDNAGPGLAQMIHVTILGVHGATIAGDRDSGVGTVELGDIDNTDGAEFGAHQLACASITAELDAAFTACEADELKRLAITWDVADDPALGMTSTIERPA